MQDRIIQLKKEVQELLIWKRVMEKQQLSFPLGVETKKIIEEDHFVVQPNFIVSGSTNIGLEVIWKGKVYYLGVVKD